MEPKISILGIAGSLRRASLNRAALRAAQELTPPGADLSLYDISALPFYDQDVEDAGAPEAVQDLRRRIAAADALLIATPEYNHSIPGVLKNAIDWASRPVGRSALNGKPAALMGVATGGFGTVRAQMHLRQILAPLSVYVLPTPQLHVAQGSAKFDAEGRLTDEPTREQIQGLLAALVAWTRRLQPR